MRKILSVLLVLVLAISMLAGCAGKTGTENKGEEYSKFPAKLTAEKVGSITQGDRYFNYAEGGIYYEENDKYGVMSSDGKNDTGAIYSYCTPKKRFFMVVSGEISEEMAIENMNNVGVIDGNGKVIVPAEYASVDVLNNRYIKVCEVTEQTDSKDEALVFYTERSMALFANDDDTFFKGNWYVYDAETGKKVDGVSGTQAYSVTANGNFITYNTDDRERKCVNGDGVALPEGAELLDDGSYIIEKDGKGTAFDTEGNKMFDYSTEDYEISFADEDDDYYVAKKYVDSEAKYMIVDKKGEIVSVEYEELPQLYGNYVFIEDKIYDFEGKVVVDGDFERASIDKMTKKAIMLNADNDEVVIFKDGGEIIYKDTENDNISVNPSYFTMSKKTDDGYLYYSLKDKDYTIDGSSFGEWTVETRSDDNAAHLVDTISGETIISGYEDLSLGGTTKSSYYVYAKKNGTIDIYLVK